MWTFRGVSTALRESGATWYLTWSTSHHGITTPREAQFVPMVRTAASVTRSRGCKPNSLDRHRSHAPTVLMPENVVEPVRLRPQAMARRLHGGVQEGRAIRLLLRLRRRDECVHLLRGLQLPDQLRSDARRREPADSGWMMAGSIP